MLLTLDARHTPYLESVRRACTRSTTSDKGLIYTTIRYTVR